MSPYFNPRRTLNLSFASSFAVQGGGSGLWFVFAIRLLLIAGFLMSYLEDIKGLAYALGLC
jgi:hypothetical protein